MPYSRSKIIIFVSNFSFVSKLFSNQFWSHFNKKFLNRYTYLSSVIESTFYYSLNCFIHVSYACTPAVQGILVRRQLYPPCVQEPRHFRMPRMLKWAPAVGPVHGARCPVPGARCPVPHARLPSYVFHLTKRGELDS